MEISVISSLLSRGSPLVINDKVDRKRGTFKPNVDVRGSVDRREFKGVYDSVVKVDM